MKKHFGFMCILFILFCIFLVHTASANEDTLLSGTLGDNIIWELDDQGLLSIYGSGDIPDYDDGYPGFMDYWRDIEKIVIHPGITGIGNYTFYYARFTTSVELPDSVTSIGDYAFSQMLALRDITIPEGVNYIGEGAFEHCWSLESLEIPAGITSILDHTFTSCGITHLTIPDTVTSIGDFAFIGSSISTIYIPDSVTTIGRAAFCACDDLWHVMYGGTQRQWDAIAIDSYNNNCLHDAFRHHNCNGTEFVDGINKVCSRCDSPCQHSWGIGEILISPGCEVPGVMIYVCDNCGDASTEEIAPTGHNMVSVVTEPNCYVDGYTTHSCTNCDYSYTDSETAALGHSYADNVCSRCGHVVGEPDYNFPLSGTCGDNLTWQLHKDGTMIISGTGEMKDYLYSEDTEWKPYRELIRTLIVEEGVASIGMNSFRFCSNLTLVSLPDTLEHISMDAFYRCSSLTAVTIPASVDGIYSSAFSNCTSLENIFFEGPAPYIGDNCFYKVTANAWYWPDKDGWTEDIMLDCDGDIFWKIMGKLTELELIRQPLSVHYVIGEVPSIEGICVKILMDNGESFVLDHSQISVESWDTSFAGRSECVISYRGLTYHVPVYVHETRTTVLLPEFAYPESQHVYGEVLNDRQSISYAGASSITLVFSAETYFEEERDYICVLDKYDNIIAQFTGSEAAGVTVVVPGDVAVILLHTNYHLCYYGYSFTAIYADSVVHTGPAVEGRDPTCTEDGYTAHVVCERCPISTEVYTISAFGHYWDEGIMIVEATAETEGCKRYTCKNCGDIREKVIPVQIPAESNNQNDHSYSTWSKVVNSYLVPLVDGGYLRIEYIKEKVVIEYYDADFSFVSRMDITPELPLFGGFYDDGQYYYLVFGQKNPEEDDAAEVVRVVKYSHSWVRLDSVSLYGANTVTPFDAGSLRMAHSGNTLYIRTSHLMYVSSDGKHHQANMMIVVNTEQMQITDECSEILNISSGYVSHSFNQFILVDGDDVIAVDHGDGFPRCVVLVRYNDCADRGDLPYYCDPISVLDIYGEIGRNRTDCAVGGLAVSADNYLVAGRSIVQDGSGATQKNIFLTVTPKDTFCEADTKFIWITSYAEGDDVMLYTPHLVQAGEDRFMLLWIEEKELCFCVLDGSGNLLTKIIRGEGKLSDCKPVVSGNKLVWYVTYYGTPVFYSIDLNAPEDYEHPHVWSEGEVTQEPTESSTGIMTYVCISCGKTYTEIIPALPHDHNYEAQTVLPTCTEQGYTTYTCTICADTYVDGYTEATGHQHTHTENATAATCVSEGYTGDVICDDCGVVVEPGNVILATGVHTYGGWSIITAPTAETDGLREHVCEYCGYVEQEVIEAGTVLWGDVNGDGRVNARDARALLRYIAGLITENELNLAAADYNGDGKINARDARALLRSIAGLA